MSEKYHYEPGATHNDHHKEINIGSVLEKSLRSIISAFFSDEGEEADAEVPSPYQDAEEALKTSSEFDPDNYRQMSFDDYGGLQ